MINTKVFTASPTPSQVLEVNSKRIGWIIRNSDALNVIKIGGPNLSFSNGFSLTPASSLRAEKGFQVNESIFGLYAVCNTGLTGVLEVLEIIHD